MLDVKVKELENGFVELRADGNIYHLHKNEIVLIDAYGYWVDFNNYKYDITKESYDNILEILLKR